MKIIFLCGSLEPGHDGVGDYCRLLGAGFSYWGSEVMLLSLNDQFILPSAKNSEENTRIPFISKRISGKNTCKTRLILAQKYITEFNPEWISLQYVPYSFHTKGMDVLLPHFFSKITGNYKWHLMVHEPWVLSDRKFSKSWLVGLIQKHILKNLVKVTRPELITTSNPYYREILSGGEIQSQLLHLPGNIPVDPRKTVLMKKEFSELGIPEDYRYEWLVLGMFGRIRSNVSYTAVLEEVLKKPEAKEKKIALLTIGNTGPFAKEICKEIEKAFEDRVLIHSFGHRDVADISAYFQLLDFGIASVPEYLLGKSGSYSAMRNHGLKILIPRCKESKECDLNIVYGSEYLEKIKNENFGSKKVAKELLLMLKRGLEVKSSRRSA